VFLLWVSSSRVKVRKADSSDLAAHLPAIIARELELHKPRRVEVLGNVVRFRGGLWRLVSSWNLLGPITRGTISIEPGDPSICITYRLVFSEVIIIGTLMVAAMGVYMAATRSTTGMNACFLPLMWLWFVVGNALFAAARFRDFIRRCVKKARRIDSGDSLLNR
jgi:hypothetical protein